MKIPFKTVCFVIFLYGSSLGSMQAEQLNQATKAICQAVISIPANYTQLQVFADDGTDLNCNCLVRQRIQFVAMDKTITSFYDPMISEYTLQNNFNTNNSYVETIEATPLYIALSREDYGLLRLLVRNGVDLNRPFDNGLRPLELVLQENKQAMVRFLLNHGAEPSYVNIGCPHSLELTRSMIQLGANPMTIDLECTSGDEDKFQSVLAMIPNFANMRLTQQDVTKLFEHPNLFETMLSRGLNVNKSFITYDHQGNKTEKTMLIQAIEAQNESAFNLLLNHGAFVNTNTKKGWTPIFYAIKTRSLTYVKKLIQKGASVTWISHENQETPLGLSVDLGLKDIIKELLESGAKPYLKLLDKEKLPLVKAFQKQDKEVIELLLQYTYMEEFDLDYYFENSQLLNNPETLDYALSIGMKSNDEILRIAILENKSEVVGIILKNNPKWNTDLATQTKLPPIYEAFENKHIVIAIQLIENGANVDTTYEGKNPLLIQAIHQNSFILVLQLLNHGANPNSVDLDGVSALQNAIEVGNYDMLKLLIDRNIGINCEDILSAIEHNNTSVLKLMLEEVGKFDCKIDGKSLKYHTKNLELSYEIKDMIKGSRWF